MSNRKGLLLAIAIIIMGMFITAGSYAFWSWASGTNKTVTYNTAKNLQNYIIYEVGNSQFSGQFKAVNSYTDGMSSTIMISKTSEAANVNLMAIIHMDINQIGDLMKSSPALKAKVTTMNAMFYGNYALVYINLSGFNTANVTNTANMFFNDSKLQAIYVSSTEPWDMTKNTDSGDMFGGLAVIVGGNGTAYNSSYKNKSRAVIDTDATPGYLTAAPTSNVLEPGSVNGNTANFLSTSIVKNKIKKITFTNTISGHSANGTDTWDVSFQKNGSVLAWVGTADGNGMYEMTIGQTGGVKALNGYGLFSYLNNLTAIDGMQYFDVSDVTLMRSIFIGCTSLTTLDLSSWDTSKVKLMNNMFNGCSNLTTIYASSLWDTSNLSNSATMFTGAANLPNFNSSVVDATNAHTGTGGYLTYKAYP